jgi:hypothetical protein
MSDVSRARTLHRLVYASRQNVEAVDLDYQVDAIIRSSIGNNRRDGLTGLLLVHDGWFVQALEGPAETVMTAYGRITRDPRHSDPTVLTAGPADRREFGDWNMCERRAAPSDAAILATLSRKGAFEPAGLKPGAALALLKAVRGVQARTAIRALA